MRRLRGWVRLRDGVGSSSGGLAAGAAVPDSNGGALDGVLSAELAHVAGVLCNLINVRERGVLRVLRSLLSGNAHLHLLHLLTERGTITGTVLSCDADLLCACIAINIYIESGGRGAVRLVILAVVLWLT